MASSRRPLLDALAGRAISIWGRLIRPFKRIPGERFVPLVTLAVLSVLLLALIMYERSQTPAPWTFPQEIEETLPTEDTAANNPEANNPASTPQGNGPATGTDGSVTSTGPVSGENTEPPARIQAEDALIWPTDGPRTKSFGWIFSETYQDYRYHSGLDFKVPAGTNVRAALSGVVAVVENGAAAGTTVILDHQDGRRTLYSGLKKVKVEPGDTVKQGQVIGQVGEPGEDEVAEGPHLHFELSRDGEPTDPVPAFKR